MTTPPASAALNHIRFVRWLALIGACWLIVQSNWWLWWLAAYTTCALPAGDVARARILSAGLTPTIVGALLSLLLTLAFWRLVCLRSAAISTPEPPLAVIAALSLAQTIAFVASDGLLLGSCPADATTASPATTTARALLAIWAALATISLGLAARYLYRLLTTAPSRTPTG
jgi:hypothetical protein